jgi:acyl-CoA synthetase (AMP-forming)/AMP-acid ligase II
VNDVYYSYADLQARVASAASLIHNQGFHQEKIAVYLKDDIDTYVAILAIWSTGNIYVPIHPSYPVYRVEQIYDVARFVAAFHLPPSWEMASNGSVLNWNMERMKSVTAYLHPAAREFQRVFKSAMPTSRHSSKVRTPSTCKSLPVKVVFKCLN